MSEQEYENIISELMNENQSLKTEKSGLQQGLSAYDQSTNSANLIHYQIDASDLLERLEHFYKGEYLSTNDAGDVVWKSNPDPSKIPLNEYGVSSYMEIISKYIDKNTTLSNYSERRIMEILADLGEELVLFTLCNYQEMGMDTNEKKTKFRLLVVTTLHLIESTYRRALSGKTFQEVNQSRIITQSDSVGFRGMDASQNSHKKRGMGSFFRNWL